MKLTVFVIGAVLAIVPAAAEARSDKDAAKAVIKAVKQGIDLSTTFPGAISAKEIASLQRVARCSAVNLMKQDDGYYTAVWDCGSKGALGMEVRVSGGSVTSISTMEVGVRPNVSRR